MEKSALSVARGGEWMDQLNGTVGNARGSEAMKGQYLSCGDAGDDRPANFADEFVEGREADEGVRFGRNGRRSSGCRCRRNCSARCRDNH